ncbi:MAG: hypothetical protein R3217_08755 [Gammaproteobacteria bacterium]|nr:hypothetical protein [Gammaproteobacteria bacterium]
MESRIISEGDDINRHDTGPGSNPRPSETIADAHRPGSWFINHDARPALRNYWFLARSSRGVKPTIHASTDCAALVITTVPLETIREPHVMAWRDSFHVLSIAELEAMALAEQADAEAARMRLLESETPDPAAL